MNQSIINADNLPLDVREHLMRGQQAGAISVLVEQHGLSNEAASKIIEEYRQNLRDRKIALDIQIMNDQNDKESREQQLLFWRWGMRIALVVGALILLYLMAGSLS